MILPPAIRAESLSMLPDMTVSSDWFIREAISATYHSTSPSSSQTLSGLIG